VSAAGVARITGEFVVASEWHGAPINSCKVIYVVRSMGAGRSRRSRS
jgi:hypothetical protein